MNTRVVGKILQAIAIAALMVGLVQGVYGDMWGELYLFIGGIVAFIAGRRIEKRWELRNQINVSTTAMGSVDEE
jgi:hypothetical protein